MNKDLGTGRPGTGLARLLPLSRRMSFLLAPKSERRSFVAAPLREEFLLLFLSLTNQGVMKCTFRGFGLFELEEFRLDSFLHQTTLEFTRESVRFYLP
jgi:hypothetical protein